MPEDFGDIKSGSSRGDDMLGWGRSHGSQSTIDSHIYERLPKATPTPKQDNAFTLKLPRTPSEVKQRATAYNLEKDYTPGSDDYKYKQWCICGPDPALTRDPKEHTEKITKLVSDMRESIGTSMGANALFMTFVKDNGELDLGVAGFIKSRLRLSGKDFPILIITNQPVLRISEGGEKKGKIDKNETPDLILVKFGRSTEDEVRRTLKLLGEELSKQDNKLSSRAINTSRQFMRLRLAAGNIKNAAVAVGKEVVIPVIVAIFFPRA